MNGRGLDFDLDPSHRENFIAVDVAEQLHLPTYGQTVDLSNGYKASFETRLPLAQSKAFQFRNLPVRATRVAYMPSENTEIVGSLGYDFLAGNIIHIDFVNGVVEAIPAAAFAADKTLTGALDIPFLIDDGALLVPMNIGDGHTDRVMFNPSAQFTMVAGNYIAQHASSIQDLSPGHHHEGVVPFADNASYGTEAALWLSDTPVLEFANLNFQNLDVLSTDIPAPHNADAQLGLDFLRFYDVYFDFPDQRLFLVPNKWFYILTGKVKPVAQ